MAHAAEDAKHAAKQQLQALGEQAKDAGANVQRRLSTLMRRSAAVSRILYRARQKQYYKLLQVRRKASKRQLKDSYRRLAKRVHPDKTSDDRAERAFQELRDALDLLNDERKRKRFDEELAKQDAHDAERRRRQREAAYRMTSRTLQKIWAWAWRHRRYTSPVAILLLMRILIA